MKKKRKTNNLEEEEEPAIDYENVKFHTDAVSVPVAVAKMLIIEMVCSSKLAHAESVTNRLGAWFPPLKIGLRLLQRSA